MWLKFLPLLLVLIMGQNVRAVASEYCTCTGMGRIVGRAELLEQAGPHSDPSRADSTRDAVERVLVFEPDSVQCVGTGGCPDLRLPVFFALPDTAEAIGATIFRGSVAEFEALTPGTYVEFRYDSSSGLAIAEGGQPFISWESWISMRSVPAGKNDVGPNQDDD